MIYIYVYKITLFEKDRIYIDCSKKKPPLKHPTFLHLLAILWELIHFDDGMMTDIRSSEGEQLDDNDDDNDEGEAGTELNGPSTLLGEPG